MELSSLRSKLQCWNTGMMEYWVLGNWDVGPLEILPLEILPLDTGGNISKNESSPLETTFHYSTIPLFHARPPRLSARDGGQVQGRNILPRKIALISVNCTICETYNYL